MCILTETAGAPQTWPLGKLQPHRGGGLREIRLQTHPRDDRARSGGGGR